MYASVMPVDANARSCGRAPRACGRQRARRAAPPAAGRRGRPARRGEAGRPRPIPDPTTRRSRSARRSRRSRASARARRHVRRGVDPAHRKPVRRDRDRRVVAVLLPVRPAAVGRDGAVPGVVEDRHLPRPAPAGAAGACGPRSSRTRYERRCHGRRSEEPQSSPQSARDSIRASVRMEATTDGAALTRRRWSSAKSSRRSTRCIDTSPYCMRTGRYRRTGPPRCLPPASSPSLHRARAGRAAPRNQQTPASGRVELVVLVLLLLVRAIRDQPSGSRR